MEFTTFGLLLDSPPTETPAKTNFHRARHHKPVAVWPPGPVENTGLTTSLACCGVPRYGSI